MSICLCEGPEDAASEALPVQESLEEARLE